MARRPIIGLTSDVRVEKRTLGFVFDSYWKSVARAGGLPLAIPPLSEAELVPQILATVDGVVIVGGNDLDPRLYGEAPLATNVHVPAERQRFDLALGKTLLASDHPVLGICYGCQLLAVVSGGALWQHVPTQVSGAVRHAGTYPDLPRHEITLRAGSRLRELLGAERVEVNSAHHQAPKRLGDGLVVTATAADGVIEGFEAPGDRFLVGVEWHPDLMPDRPEQRRLFEAVVEEAARRVRV
jgi:putative glutamine amidotransferase